MFPGATPPLLQVPQSCKTIIPVLESSKGHGFPIQQWFPYLKCMLVVCFSPGLGSSSCITVLLGAIFHMCLTIINWEKIFLVFALLSIFEDLPYLGGKSCFFLFLFSFV